MSIGQENFTEVEKWGYLKQRGSAQSWFGFFFFREWGKETISDENVAGRDKNNRIKGGIFEKEEKCALWQAKKSQE